MGKMMEALTKNFTFSRHQATFHSLGASPLPKNLRNRSRFLRRRRSHLPRSLLLLKERVRCDLKCLKIRLLVNCENSLQKYFAANSFIRTELGFYGFAVLQCSSNVPPA